MHNPMLKMCKNFNHWEFPFRTLKLFALVDGDVKVFFQKPALM